MKPEIRSINRSTQLPERPFIKRSIGKAPEWSYSASLADQSHQQPSSPQHQHLNDKFFVGDRGQKQAYPAQYVGSLAVVWRSDLEQFHLLTCPEAEQLSSHCFATFEHCFSAAVELLVGAGQVDR